MKYIEVNEHRADELIKCGCELLIHVKDDKNNLVSYSIVQGSQEENDFDLYDVRTELIMKLPSELNEIPLTLRYYEIWDN